jgi:hypothetical protein
MPTAENVSECLRDGESLQLHLEAAVRAAGDGLVYFVQCDERGPIKIGYTRGHKLKQRLSGLQVGSPFPLILRRTFPGTRELERKLHDLFRTERLTGEWFWATPELASVAHGKATPRLAHG